jgi:predicted thioesterase
MVMWTAAAPGQPTAAEQRMYFADYRDVDGLKLPFRIRRAVGADTIEETTFDRFRINAKIDPRKFEMPK